MTSHSVFMCLYVLIYPEVHLCVLPASVFVCVYVLRATGMCVYV